MCNLLLQDACAIGDNNTIMDKTGFYNDVMFGPQLPPPSWQTKVSSGIVNTTVVKFLLNFYLEI